MCVHSFMNDCSYFLCFVERRSACRLSLTSRFTCPSGTPKKVLGSCPGAFFCFIFCLSHLLYSPIFSLSFQRVTQTRGHIAGSSPPFPREWLTLSKPHTSHIPVTYQVVCPQNRSAVLNGLILIVRVSFKKTRP